MDRLEQHLQEVQRSKIKQVPEFERTLIQTENDTLLMPKFEIVLKAGSQEQEFKMNLFRVREDHMSKMASLTLCNQMLITPQDIFDAFSQSQSMIMSRKDQSLVTGGGVYFPQNLPLDSCFF